MSENSSNDELVAEVLESLMSEMRDGRQPDVEGAVREHPELAEEIRELWGAMLIAEELATPDAAASADTKPHRDSDREKLLKEFGDFDLLEEIGRGGMGVVYRAQQRSLERVVALKMLIRGEFASEADLDRFRAEAEAAAHLDHPHIVPVYEVGDHDGSPYFTMRYVEGETLARVLTRGPMAAQEAAELMVPICHAVQYAHDRGVLHRDLKPSNIIIDLEGRPHVSDFGLAKRIDAQGTLTQSGAILGTPSYMAPEQAAGTRGEISPATDVYGLGTILYQMLTGRPPFMAPTPVDTVIAVLEQDPLPPRLLNRQADPDLEMITLKCLQKPADLRYPNAEAMANDLEAHLAGDPISARSTDLVQIVSRILRETHHAGVLESWGLLWMMHSVALIILCFLTNWFKHIGMDSPEPYIGLWSVGFGAWASIFWAMRNRAGPITFVERQIAHVWASSVIANIMLFFVEIIMKLPVLTLSPAISLISGMVFFVKAGILSGMFYFQAAALFLTALVMALYPAVGISIFGIVSALCFFIPGLKYYRQRQQPEK